MPTISSPYFLNLVRAFERLGYDHDLSEDSILGDVDKVKNPRHRIPLDQFAAALDIVGKQTGLENIGLETAFQNRVSTIADTGSILVHCKSLAHAAEFHEKYAILSETVADPKLERRDNGVFMMWRERFTDHEKYRHVTEALLGGYIVTTNWMSWSFERGVKAVSFRHSPPADLSRHKSICKCPVYFNQDENWLQLEPEYVDHPLPNADPEIIAEASKILDRVKLSIAHQSTMEVQAFSAVMKGIRNGSVSASIVADELGISERTFRRRLKEKGSTYRKLVDNVRQTLCRKYMSQERSLTEIAQILGYNDQSAFTRAYKKWYGKTPSQHKVMEFSI